MFACGDAVIFCGDAVVRRMLAALCGENPPRIVIADGDDPAAQAEAFRCCRERGVPVILISRTPASVRLPDDIQGHVLSRPFLFADFRAVLRALCDPDAPAPMREAPPSVPLIRWDSVRRAVICGGAEVILTPREADVFAALYAAAPAAVSREMLQKDFARTAGNGADVYISYLRKKLAALPLSVRIHAERGRGYALLIQPADVGSADQSSGETK